MEDTTHHKIYLFILVAPNLHWFNSEQVFDLGDLGYTAFLRCKSGTTVGTVLMQNMWIQSSISNENLTNDKF